MTDREIRKEIIKLIIPRMVSLSYEEAASILEVSEISAKANMIYLAEQGFALKHECVEKGFCGLLPNRKSETYLIEPDENFSSTSIHISGNQNLVAGKNFSVTDSVILSEVSIPPSEVKELNQLIQIIRDGSLPKKEQESKVRSFFEKLVVTSSSSVLAACAVAIFKATVGLS